MKIINGFLFLNRKWADRSPTTECININQITTISERNNAIVGRHVRICTTDCKECPISDYNNVEEFMIDFIEALDNYLTL